jgi:hypothetical protein
MHSKETLMKNAESPMWHVNYILPSAVNGNSLLLQPTTMMPTMLTIKRYFWWQPYGRRLGKFLHDLTNITIRSDLTAASAIICGLQYNNDIPNETLVFCDAKSSRIFVVSNW